MEQSLLTIRPKIDVENHIFSAVLLLLIRCTVSAAGSHSSVALTNSEPLSWSRRRALLYRLVGAGRNTVSHASPKATKTGQLIFAQLGSATPLRRVALLLLLVCTECQTGRQSFFIPVALENVLEEM